MSLWTDFLSNNECGLKICGVTLRKDAQMLLEENVPALGVNFWPQSKRFISPTDASPWLKEIQGKILRVGVFVNPTHEEIAEILQQGIIDVAQLHGHESPEFMEEIRTKNFPVIKAWGVKSTDDHLGLAAYSRADAWLLDTPAPGIFGGTGEAFDWSLATSVAERYPNQPILLAGGITAENAAAAVQMLRPSALDVASGAEISPGRKDRAKVRDIIQAMTKKM